MSDTVVVAIFAFAGTVIGGLLGILAANKLVMYRIEQLEKKVDKHNSVIERVAVLERDGKTAFRRIDELREEVKKSGANDVRA